MRQYCRYCVHCAEGDGYICTDHPKGRPVHLTEEHIKRENRCPNFDLTDDVITGREYQPREYRPREHRAAEDYEEGQMSFF